MQCYISSFWGRCVKCYIRRGKSSIWQQVHDLRSYMINDSENDQFFMACKVGNFSFRFVPNKKYEGNLIAMLVINCVLFFSTISLNAISVVTIRKSSQLKGKVCYFVILVQSAVDLGVGLLSIPLFISYLIFPFLNTGNCTVIILAIGASYLPGLSM